MCIRDSSIVKNTDFINRVKSVELQPKHKLASLDITDLYTNIPVIDTLQILRNNLSDSRCMNTQMINELINLLEVVLKQNYFTFDGLFYFQDGGLAMGSPLSVLLADIYLNFYENTHKLNTVSYTHLDVYKRQL